MHLSKHLRVLLALFFGFTVFSLGFFAVINRENRGNWDFEDGLAFIIVTGAVCIGFLVRIMFLEEK